ncbi:hypothetical protein COO91_08629 [Nostoc flagelliforme CCNUN1]|uniref:Uncharacterized protein n=1 Tax=Nostoc flagelliforme CCNUN1 TaxID=2038116 RepID=A0A2K8T4I2_9NOSO|nr:hypothetical protein [Nostoc flagelliforme]AUB42493.1 hypothetical protein COO91_08629 [Nostoc flagelliforme CCNUN1]
MNSGIGYAIAYLPHLLTFLGQVVEGLQMLQANGVLSIPDSHGATELIYLGSNAIW